MTDDNVILSKIARYTLLRYDAKQKFDIQCLESMLLVVAPIQICDILVDDELNRFSVSDDHVEGSVTVITRHLRGADECALEEIRIWRNILATFLNDRPPCRLAALGPLKPRSARDPLLLSYDIKLKELLMYDPGERFELIGEGDDITVTRKLSSEEITACVDEWKSAILIFLKRRIVSISEIGAILPRPKNLPNRVKLLEVLRTDPLNRFHITTQGSMFLVRQNFFVKEEKKICKKLPAVSIEEWKNNIAEFVFQQGGPVSLSILGGNFVRPIGLLKTELKLRDVLKSDPCHRFILNEIPNGYDVTLSKSTLNNMHAKKVTRLTLEDERQIPFAVAENDGWTEVIHSKANRKFQPIQQENTELPPDTDKMSDIIVEVEETYVDANTACNFSNTPNSGTSLVIEQINQDVKDISQIYPGYGTSFFPAPYVSNGYSFASCVSYSGLTNTNVDSFLYNGGTDGLTHTSASHTSSIMGFPVPSIFFPPALPTVEQHPDTYPDANKANWMMNSILEGGSPTPFEFISASTLISNLDHLFETLDMLLEVWFFLVFKGFDTSLISTFHESLKGEGFITVQDLLYAKEAGQLTITWLGQVAGFKQGHFNRLIKALEKVAG